MTGQLQHHAFDVIDLGLPSSGVCRFTLGLYCLAIWPAWELERVGAQVW